MKTQIEYQTNKEMGYVSIICAMMMFAVYFLVKSYLAMIVASGCMIAAVIMFKRTSKKYDELKKEIIQQEVKESKTEVEEDQTEEEVEDSDEDNTGDVEPSA